MVFHRKKDKVGKETGKCFLIFDGVSRGYIHRFSMPGEHPPEIKKSDPDRPRDVFFSRRAGATPGFFETEFLEISSLSLIHI